MAKVELYTRQVLPRPSGGGALQDVASAGYLGGVIAQGGAELADQFQRAEKVRRDAATRMVVAARVATAKRDYARVFAERSTQPAAEFSTLVSDLETASVDIFSRAAAGLTPEQQAEVEREVNTHLQGQLADAELVARKQENETIRGHLDVALAAQRQVLAGLDPSSPRYEVELERGLKMVRDAEALGAVGHEQSAARQADFLSGSEALVARRAIRDHPKETYLALLDESQFPNLDPDERTRLQNIAFSAANAEETRQYRLADRAERAAEKALKERQEVAEAGWRLKVRNNAFFRESAAREELETMLHERVIDPTRYDEMTAWLDAVNREGGFDDPRTVKQLKGLIYLGDLTGAEALRRVRSELINGNVSANTYGELEDLILEDPPALRTPDARAAAQYLRERLGVIAGTMGSSFSPVLVGRANYQFYQRVVAGEDPAEVVNEMIPRFTSQLAGLQRAAMEQPRFESMVEAVEAFHEGRIGKGELESELEVHRARMMSGGGAGTSDSGSSGADDRALLKNRKGQ